MTAYGMKIDINKWRAWLRRLLAIPNVAAASFLLLTLATAGNYGYYGDELYFISCGKHLDWGYVDHPPLIALFTLIATRVLGDTIVSLRLVSGLAGATTVLLSARVASALGGGKVAQSLAALSICFAPAFPALSSFLSMNPIDVMLCTLFFLVFLKTIQAPSPGKWFTVGILFGLGLLNKYTFLVLGFALLLSLVVTRRWSVLRSKWLYVSGAIALMLFVPHILWQIANDWPTAAFMRNATAFKNLDLSPIAFMSQLILGLNPLMLPLWASGVLYLLLAKSTKEHRFLGWMALMFVLVYLLRNSKFVYVLPVFPLLLGSGAVLFERFLQNSRRRWPWWIAGCAVIVSGAALMPLAVPILPVEKFVSYAKTLGLWNAVRMEKGEGDTLPIHFVHRFGWEEVAESVGKAYGGLPVSEREDCAILASWYAIAGAVDHFGPRYGLPNAICPHNSYWIWGTHDYSGQVVLAVGYSTDSLREYFDSVEQLACVTSAYAYDCEIHLCRKPRMPLSQMWDQLRTFI